MIESERIEICKRIKTIRNAVCGNMRGAQRTFADAVNISYGTYRNYEKSRVCLGALKNISIRTGISLNAIVFGGNIFKEQVAKVEQIPVYRTKKDKLIDKEIAKSKWKDIHELSEAIEKIQNGNLIYEKNPMVNMTVRISLIGEHVSLFNEDNTCIINPEDLKNVNSYDGITV